MCFKSKKKALTINPQIGHMYELSSVFYYFLHCSLSVNRNLISLKRVVTGA